MHTADHITILPSQVNPNINYPPIPNQDDNIAYLNTPVNGQVLSNDYDCESTQLVATTISSPPTSGSAVISPSGQYTYLPNPGFKGKDQFSYEVCDTGSPVLCATSVVYITVLDPPVNNKPPFAGDDFTVTAMDSSITANAFHNDQDPTADPFVVTQVNNSPVSSTGTTVLTYGGMVTITPNGDYTYTPPPNYVGADQFTYQICDMAGGCSNATVYLIVHDQTCVNIQLNVLLEGALWDISSQQYLPQMRTNLNTSRSILPGQIPVNPLATPTPAGQPYALAPYNYPGTTAENTYSGPYAADIVDWVLVSFRSGIQPSSEFKQAAGLLHKDGTIEFVEPSILTINGPNPVYIMVEHRNHMGILSPIPVPITNGSLQWNFTQENSYQQTSFGQKEVAPGVWAMYAGDCDQVADLTSYEINGNDGITTGNQNGYSDHYLSGDLNLDGEVSGVDKILFSNNNGIFSSVPK